MTAESEAEAREMQMALGRAVSAWGNIEANLCGIFEFAVTGRFGAAANQAYCAVHSAEVQIAMTSAAIKVALAEKPDALTHWGHLFKRIDKLRERRNALAHGQIIVSNAGAKWSVDFLPFYHAARQAGAEGHQHWAVPDLMRLEEAFRALALDLWQFHFALLEHDQLPQLSPAPDLQLGRAPARKRLVGPRQRSGRGNRGAPQTKPKP